MDTQQEELVIHYKGQQIKITPQSEGINTFFIAHLPEGDVELKTKYIGDNSFWVENGDAITDRSAEIGRLIEEHDAR